MTVENITPLRRVIYTGPGDYEFSFPVLDDADLLVYHIDTSGVSTPLVLTADYALEVYTLTDGGKVTTINPTASGGVLDISRSLDYVQPDHWETVGPLDLRLLERSFDRMVMLLQQMKLAVTGADVRGQWAGAWAAGNTYALGQVTNAPGYNLYVCIAAHTAAATFAADLAGGKWLLIIDVAAAASSVALVLGKDAVDALGVIAGSCTGNAATATTLKTARTIGGVGFNGSANINLPGVNIAGNQNTSGTASYATIAGSATTAGFATTAGSCTGNAATATTLQNTRTIGGVGFNGSANINLPGVNIAGNQNTSGTATYASTAVYANSAGSAPASDVYAWAKAASPPVTYTPPTAIGAVNTYILGWAGETPNASGYGGTWINMAVGGNQYNYALFLRVA